MLRGMEPLCSVDQLRALGLFSLEKWTLQGDFIAACKKDEEVRFCVTTVNELWRWKEFLQCWHFCSSHAQAKAELMFYTDHILPFWLELSQNAEVGSFAVLMADIQLEVIICVLDLCDILQLIKTVMLTETRWLLVICNTSWLKHKRRPYLDHHLLY